MQITRCIPIIITRKAKKLNCGWECLEFEQFTAEQNVRLPPFALVIPLFCFLDNEAIL